ncbi:MAG: hypothetical protein IT581_17365 [Verrucomicrobiales bacterium]|nr:hypothetical protein [Verrucomicrobiales bacterium]
MPDSVPPQEDASLYVLDLLEGADRDAFEANLAESADLQRQVRELQVNLEALALAAPPRIPRPRVWEAIAKSTAAPIPPTIPWWSLVLRYVRNGWAVAGLLTLAWLLFSLPRSGTRDVESLSDTAADSPHSPTTPQITQRSRHRSDEISRKSLASALPANASAASNQTETQPLKDRVRVLSEQVAVLTQVLAQRTVLPPGASQLRVFRLVGTNVGPETLDALATEAPRLRTETSSVDLSFALTLAAARQIAAANPPKESLAANDNSSTEATSPPSAAPNSSTSALTQNTPAEATSDAASPSGGSTTATTDVASLAPTADPGAGALADGVSSGTTTVASRYTKPGASTDTESTATTDAAIQVVDLSGGLASTTENLSFGNLVGPDTTPGSTTKSSSLAAESAAFGTYELETGIGSIAFRNTVDPNTGEVLQLWVTDPHSGAVQSLGFVHSTNPVVVLRFRTDPALFVNPNFLVTLEPEGGSATPTGPVVAQPPPTFSPVQPTP